MPKNEDDRKVGPVFRVLSQDLYSTGFHGEEVGLRQHEVWRAKSRQFSRDADIIGKIEEAKTKRGEKKLSRMERIGFIILRKSIWHEQEDELLRRLVLKLFTARGSWVATIEEMVADEFTASYVSDKPMLSLAVVTRESEVITYIRQVRRGAMATENYAFYILGPNKTFEVFRIEGKRATMGDDFKVVRLASGKTVAEIDSKWGDIGGEFVVKVKDSVLAENEWFCRILQCFSVVIAYRGEIFKKLEKGLKMWPKGKDTPLQHRHEISLLANPRKLTLKTEEFEEV